MNWEAIGALGEVLGAAAVVLTLAYLAIQMRQNSLGLKVAAKQEMTRQYADFANTMLIHPELADIHRRGAASEELSDEETYIFGALMNKATWYMASMHYQYNVHNMSEDDWRQSKHLIARYCDMPGFRTYWQDAKDSYSSAFAQYIENHWHDAN